MFGGGMISGVGANLIADSRVTAKLSDRTSPLELIQRLRRITTILIEAVEKNGGIVHLHIGGSLIAYWAPERMAAAMRDSIAAAKCAVAACGESVAVSVAIADFTIADVGPQSAKRP